MPKLINQNIYMTFPELESLKINTGRVIKNKISDGSFDSIKAPTDKRKVLVLFSTLPKNYQDEILTTMGDPAAICQMENQKAQRDRLEGGCKEIDLTTYWEIDADDADKLKKSGRIDGKDHSLYLDILFAAAVCKWYNDLKPSQTAKYGYADKAKLQEALHKHPRVQALKCLYSKNFRVFQRAFTAYKNERVLGLVSKKLGNQNNLKLRTEEQKEVLKRLFASHKNRDYVWITDDYNKVARLNDWPELSETTVMDFIDSEAKMHGILFRNGVGKFKADVLPTIHRERPSRPGYMWEGDGTPWELYYQYKKDGKSYYWGRKVVYVISDAFNDCPVGWAIGDSENVDLITAAWKNAIENTGMMPWQIRVDNFAKKAMGKVYSQITEYFIPAGVGNARAKLIEQMFSRFSATRILKQYDNWSGCNITNRNDSNQPNRDFIDEQKKNFPDENGVIDQINESINEFRNQIIKKDGLVRFDAWCEALKNTQKVRTAGLEELINVFGIYRDEIKETYTYTFTKEGLIMIIDGEEHCYMDWGQPDDQESMDKAIQNYQELFGASGLRVKYLPENLDMIRVDHLKRGKTYFLTTDQKTPGCVMDAKDNPKGAELIWHKIRFHKELIGAVVRKHENTIAVTNAALNHMTVDAMGALKSMFTVDGSNKQYLNNAKSTLKALDRTISERRINDIYDDDLDDEDLVPVAVNTNEDLYD